MAASTAAARSTPATTRIANRSEQKDQDVAARSPLQVFGKAAPGSGSPSDQRGDCPFSQKVYLELEERGLSYVATYIEEGREKPDWFMEHNPSGLLPVLRDRDQWIQDSDKITDHLNQNYPEESENVKTPEDLKDRLKRLTDNVFGSFTKWLKSNKEDDGAKRDYEKGLRDLNEHLKQNGPYLAGDRPTDADFDLAPKLRHARVALANFMDYQIPVEFAAVLLYIDMMENRDSFQRTDSPDSDITRGWQNKFDLRGRTPQAQAA